MIFAGLGREAKIGGEEGAAAMLGNQFLGGIAFVAPALAAEFAVETRRMFRLMRRLMREGGVIALGVLERLERRHLHIVVVNRVVGAVAAEADVGGDRS